MAARFRVGAFAGVLAAGAAIAFGATNCAAPTQIIIDVRAEKALCDKNGKPGKFIVSTGIAVSTPDQIDKTDLSIFEGSGCDDPPGDQIGTLTITPRGDREAEVAVRIVSGVTKTAQFCDKPFDGCIVARRNVRFVPNQTVNITVIMGEKCLSKDCKGLECDPKTGDCVEPTQVQEDGAVTPLPEGGKDQLSPTSDTGSETGTPEAGFDACSNCMSPGVCNSNTNPPTCTMTCTNNTCNKTVCGPGVDCNVTCAAQGACNGTKCLAGPTGKCTFVCGSTVGGPQTRCDNIVCAAATCKLTCKDLNQACDNITLDSGVNDVTCLLGQTGTEVSCDDVGCGGGVCIRTCDDGGSACSKNPACAEPPAISCAGWQVGDGGP